MKNGRTKGLKEAIKAVGSGHKLARRLGITPQAVALWKEVPLNRVLQVERVTGIRREILRPDMYI